MRLRALLALAAVLATTWALAFAGCAGGVVAGRSPGRGTLTPYQAYLQDKGRAVRAGYEVVRLLFHARGEFTAKVPQLAALTRAFDASLVPIMAVRLRDPARERQRGFVARVGKASARTPARPPRGRPPRRRHGPAAV